MAEPENGHDSSSGGVATATYRSARWEGQCEGGRGNVMEGGAR